MLFSLGLSLSPCQTERASWKGNKGLVAKKACVHFFDRNVPSRCTLKVESTGHKIGPSRSSCDRGQVVSGMSVGQCEHASTVS